MAVSRVALAVPAVRETVLENGLKVLVQEVHTAPLASVWCWYKVGSKDEGPGLTGVSHWVEHMNFKGTRQIPREQVKGIIEQFGGTWNGYTWIDQTTYLETASRDAIDRMLFIEAERMHACLYEPEDCESERTVIISELKGGENDPEHLLDTELTATAFKVHPYRHPTIGWQHDLETMTRDDLYGHYSRYYLPTTPRWSSSGMSIRTTSFAGSSIILGRSHPARKYSGQGRRTGPGWRAPGPLAQAGHNRVLARRVPCTGRDRPRLLSVALRRCRTHWSIGTQSVVRTERTPAAAERAAVSGAGGSRAGGQCRRFGAADRASLSVSFVGDGRRRSDARRG